MDKALWDATALRAREADYKDLGKSEYAAKEWNWFAKTRKLYNPKPHKPPLQRQLSEISSDTIKIVNDDDAMEVPENIAGCQHQLVAVPEEGWLRRYHQKD